MTDLERPIWKVAPRDALAESRLQAELGVPSILAAVLVARGLANPAEADAFLNPSLDQLHDPSLLPDYRPAVAAILGARERGETVYVHGDYDADGVTSAALLSRFLTRIGCRVVAHVPHRMREGYGIHPDAVSCAAEAGARLFLTCDCGVSAHRQVEAAREAGMAVVITDHHEPPETLPPAHAVVNPHRRDSRYPFPEISGVGVALKLCAGITKEMGWPVDKFYRAYLDLAALGTVSDVMPLLGENRVIVKFGLEALLSSRKPGVQALLEVSQLAGAHRLQPSHIGFQLGPRLNAVGRIDDAEHALKLLLSDEIAEARPIAALLDRVNRERQEEQRRCVDEAIARLEQEGWRHRHAIVVADESWHAGIVGLIAGQIVQRLRRPAFVATRVDDLIKGSVRSIDGFHAKAALDAVARHLGSYGGHAKAAGFTLGASTFDDLAAALEAEAARLLTPESFVERIHVEAEVDATEACDAAFEALDRLAPFGESNPAPRFVCRDLRLASCQPTAKPEHVRLSFTTSAGPRPAMAFRIGERVSRIPVGSTVDVAFRIDENVFNGRRSIRWTVDDVQPA